MITGRMFAPEADGTLVFRGTCVLCGQPSSVSGLVPSQVAAFNDGKGLHIQEAFPQLSAGDRETILSGMHEDCFDEEYHPDSEDLEPSWWPWS